MRIITIVMTELATDKLKAEEKLQRLMNDQGDLEDNVFNIKNLLREIVLIESMIMTWKNYTANDDANNEEEKKQN